MEFLWICKLKMENFFQKPYNITRATTNLLPGKALKKINIHNKKKYEIYNSIKVVKSQSDDFYFKLS